MQRLFLTSILALMLLTACDQADPPRFRAGDHVKSVLTGDVGMIRYVRPRKSLYCRYNVRFSALQFNTDTHFLSADGPITLSPLATVKCMGEWELEPAGNGD